MSKGILIVALILVAIAGLFAWFVGKSIEGESHALPVANGTDSRETAGLLRSIDSRLQEIERRLGRLEQPRVGEDAAADSGPRTPDASEREELLKAIRDLRPAVGSAIAPNPWPVLLPKSAQAGPRWDELQRFYEEYLRDKSEAVRTVLFQPASKIWERFGTPNQIPALEGIVSSGLSSIGYSRESENGVDGVELYFECGFVVGAHASGN